MSRENKLTAGVFTQIVGNERTVPSYERFMKLQDSLKKPSKELKGLLTNYKSLITKNKVSFDIMARLEEVIMQMRVRDNLKFSDIKFIFVRDQYIYARIPFYRGDKDLNEIRVLIGLTEFHGADPEKFSGDKVFVEKTMSRMLDEINKIVNYNLNNLQKLTHNEENQKCIVPL